MKHVAQEKHSAPDHDSVPAERPVPAERNPRYMILGLSDYVRYNARDWLLATLHRRKLCWRDMRALGELFERYAERNSAAAYGG